MTYLGDFLLGDTLDFKFTTRQATGAPTTLAGSPAVAAYPSNSTTEVTAGITLSVDFDSRTGLNSVRVVATAANGYLAGTNYAVVVTAGTVNSVSVVGETVAHFSIENRQGGGVLLSGTAQAGASGSVTLPSTAVATDSYYVGTTVNVVAGTGAGQAGRYISAYVGSTKVATVDPAWTTTPDNTSVVRVFGTPPSPTTAVPAVNTTFWNGSAVATPINAGYPLIDLKYVLGTISPAAAGSVRADAVTGAVGSVTGSVGSVTGLTAADVGAIRTKTDSLTFTVSGKVDANITHVIADPVKASSSKTTNWGGT